MADSFSTNLAIRLPATGAYNNTWGVTLNADAFQLLDTAIAGGVNENVGTAVAFSMPALTPGAASDSRNFCINFQGNPAGTLTVTIPSSVPSRLYLINNELTSNQSIVITYTGSLDTVTVPPNTYQLVWCDGENVWPVSAAAAIAAALQGTNGGIPATSFVRSSLTTAEIDADVTVINQISIPTGYPWVVVADAPVLNLDMDNGDAQQCTIAGNRTVPAISNPFDGAELVLLIIQDGTGSRTLTWNSIYWFENGEAPTLASIPGAIDMFWMRYNANLNKWLVAHFYNLNAGAGTTSTITISENCLDWNLSAVVGTLASAQTINIVVAQGVIIEASSTAVAAMDLSGIISGSTINLTNNGYILGHGGKGGRGGGWVGGTSFGFQMLATAGKAAGPGINGPGSGCSFNLVNNGYVWGGGGGGGVAGWASLATANSQVSVGGGGGGAGNGLGGICFPLGDANGSVVSTDGADGNYSPTSATPYGTAGANAVIGTADAGASGAGGNWGVAGTNGTAAGTSHTVVGALTNGGAAGNAIALNGGGVTITPSSGGSAPHIKGSVS